MFKVDGTVKTRFNGGNKWYKGTRSKKLEVTGGDGIIHEDGDTPNVV